MKTDLYNQQGDVLGSVTLPEQIFDVKFNADLVHQVAVSLYANKRQPLAHSKTRGEVRGGGRKPWRQKGTGRARHGSNRSPIWKGGGVTFGPRNDKDFSKEIPRKMRRKALLMVLSQKLVDNQLIVLDKIELENGKTKEMVKTISSLPCNNHSTLIALPGYDKKIFLASRNIKKVSLEDARNLNVLDILNAKYLLITKDSVDTIRKVFVSQSADSAKGESVSEGKKLEKVASKSADKKTENTVSKPVDKKKEKFASKSSDKKRTA